MDVNSAKLVAVLEEAEGETTASTTTTWRAEESGSDSCELLRNETRLAFLDTSGGWGDEDEE